MSAQSLAATARSLGEERPAHLVLSRQSNLFAEPEIDDLLAGLSLPVTIMP